MRKLTKKIIKIKNLELCKTTKGLQNFKEKKIGGQIQVAACISTLYTVLVSIPSSSSKGPWNQMPGSQWNQQLAAATEGTRLARSTSKSSSSPAEAMTCLSRCSRRFCHQGCLYWPGAELPPCQEAFYPRAFVKNKSRGHSASNFMASWDSRFLGHLKLKQHKLSGET